MAEKWRRGERDGLPRTPLQSGEHRGPGDHPAPPTDASTTSDADEPTPSEQAAANQERALESGEENVV
jgi:hypothetical protein